MLHILWFSTILLYNNIVQVIIMSKSNSSFERLRSFIAKEIRHTDWLKEFKSVGIFVTIFAAFLALIFFIPPLLVTFGQVQKDSALYDMVSVNLFSPYISFYVTMLVLFTGIFLIIQLGQSSSTDCSGTASSPKTA